MMKFKVLYKTADGTSYTEMHNKEPTEDEYFISTDIYLELTRIEAIENSDPYKGQKCSMVFTYSGDRHTLVYDMDALADMVDKAKQIKLIMN